MLSEKTETKKVKLKPDDIIILRGLEKYGPREGFIKLKQKLNEEGFNGSYNKLIYRISKMIKNRVFLVKTILDIRKFDLMVVQVKFKTPIKRINTLIELLRLNPTLAYYSRSYTGSNLFSLFYIPNDSYLEFRAFLDFIRNSGLAEVESQIVEENIYPSIVLEWYDFKRGELICRFEEFKNEIPRLIEEVSKAKENQENNEKKEEKIIRVEFLDNWDIWILKSLEKNAMSSLTEMANKMNTAPALLKYHIDEHIEPKNLIYKFFVNLNPEVLYKDNVYVNLNVKFKDEAWQKAFVEGIKNKLLVFSIRKLSDDSASIKLNLPYNGIIPLQRLLWEYIEEDILENFELNTLDPRYSMSYTLPWEIYKNGRFEYPHEKIMREVEERLTPVIRKL
jgi:DNA-binding Lrp family transcriptional regulator